MARQELQTETLLNGRYEILRPLGRGGMGTVYLAQHVRLDAQVAVKEIHGEFSDDAEYQAALKQCEQEARTLVRLNHANLPKVTDAFIENDRFYLVMEYIEGVTLEAKLIERRGLPLPVPAVIEWGLQITDVLGYLHSLDPPLIFRDLKPSNVMLRPDGRICLIDFGIARQFQPGAAKDTALLGSVGYSPPEQFGRNQTEPRSDLYALGASLHHLLTGRDPAATPFKFPPARSLNLLVPEALSRLLADCLEIDVEKRPASARDFAMRLLAIRDAMPTLPPSTAEMAALAHPGANAAEQPGTLSVPDTIKAPISSNPLPKLPSGAILDPSTPRSKTPIWVIGSLFGVILVLLTLVGIKRHNFANKPPAPTPPVTIAPVMPAPIEPPAPPTAPAPSAQSDDPAPPPASNPIVEFTKIESPGLVPDATAGYLLQINVAGICHSQAGKTGIIAAFFYDANDAPLPAIAQNPDRRYVNSDGQLSVAATITAAGNDAPFAVSLLIPLSQFPPAAMNTPLKIRSRVFFDGRRLATSEPYLLPFLLRPVAPPPQTTPPVQTAPARSDTGGVPFSITPRK